MSKQELLLLAGMLDTDTVSVERSHSMNNMRGLSRALTHALDLPTLDAYYVGRNARDESSGSRNSRDQKVIRKRPAAARKSKEKSRTAGGGAWRAFVHVQAAGQKADAAFFC